MFRTDLNEDGVEIAYQPKFIAGEQTRGLFEAVFREAAWEQPTIQLFGRSHQVPRLVAWHGDEGCKYRYSGQEHAWHPWTPALERIRRLVEKDFGPQQAVLANFYLDGSHGIGAHADDEDDLAPEAPILMVSLGAVRRFVIKHRTTKARHVLEMEDGSLLVMGGRTNSVAVHSLPKTKQVVGPRISLTFRRMNARKLGA